jgi:hypothetical protein
MKLSWYVRRLSRMSAPEVAMRGRDSMVKLLWRREWVREMEHDRSPLPQAPGVFHAVLPRERASAVTGAARDRLMTCADQLMQGRWKTFALERADVGADPDWFTDPRTGRRGPASRYCFQIDHRSEETVGNIKYVWELSRHHHLTVLATAYFLTGDERYALRASEHLTSWWRRNPFLSGVHWTSGIEVGVRLISWVWVRRLLADWPAAAELFERNPVCLRQLRHHQRYLATLTSHSSSANNHVVAEAAGLFTAACAFPWFPESAAWRARAATMLRQEIGRQTFPCGLNRELATDYHALVLELSLVAALEGEATGHSLGPESWEWICRMTDAIAAIVDERLQPPRQGDSDDGTALLLDDPGYDRWRSLLATGEALLGAMDWWPRLEPAGGAADVRTMLWTALVPEVAKRATTRPVHRTSMFPDAGMVILRDVSPRSGYARPSPEIWCRCDHGPLGFLSVAAHGHADALAVEVRHGGVDVLADPGTYCYHGERAWRAYFRSTLAHNTLELNGASQSEDGGPFLWLRPVPACLLQADGLDSGPRAVWEAQHHGYNRLPLPAIHRRRVELDREARALTVVDWVESDAELACRLAFHLGPAVEADISGEVATLRWRARDGGEGVAEMRLPAELAWAAERGRTDAPFLGWYSPAFDERQAATTLVGTGRIGRGRELRTILAFGW